MIKAYRMQEKTAQVGFEWNEKEQVWEKVQEEIREFREVPAGDSVKKEDEFGDILFALVNYARFENIDPETALEKTNAKFRRRFEYIEAMAPKPLNDMSLEEMDTLWNEAKSKEPGGDK
jgi:XTP/dITP diphosphohydrolase